MRLCYCGDIDRGFVSGQCELPVCSEIPGAPGVPWTEIVLTRDLMCSAMPGATALRNHGTTERRLSQLRVLSR
jgi:hypothetical protein